MPRELRFLVLTEATKKSGLGNYKRSEIICRELSLISNVKLVVITNGEPLEINEAPSSYMIEKIVSIEDFCELGDEFSHVLIDVGTLDLTNFIYRQKKKSPGIKLIALDYFFESKLLDLRISIFNHSTNEFKSTDSNHLVGLSYAVLDELGEIAPEKHSLPVITVRFSGESSNFLERTVRLLDSFYPQGTVQINVIDNTGECTNKSGSLPRSDFLSMISNSELVICSGVTTLFECSLLGVATVFVGSNRMETSFGEKLAREDRIKFLNGYSEQYENQAIELLQEIDFVSMRNNLIPKLNLDFRGKHRILKAILTL